MADSIYIKSDFPQYKEEKNSMSNIKRIPETYTEKKYCNIFRKKELCFKFSSYLVELEKLDLILYSCDYHKNDLEHLADFLKLESRFQRLN